MSSLLGNDLLAACAVKTKARSARVSSWDHSGQNEDAFVVQPGQTINLADIKGPGAIKHLWFVQTCRKILGPGLPFYTKAGAALMDVNKGLGLVYEDFDPDYYRKIVIKFYWEGQSEPSVLAPLGDFFCIGHSLPGNFDSLPFSVSTGPADNHKYGGNAACNCYLTMPFNESCRIEVTNEGELPYFQYFYIDYELYQNPIKDILHFHAQWNRSNPTKGWAPWDLQTNSLETMVPNLDGKNNYVVLDTTGEGNFVGMNHSVTHFQGTWWGEGDDMIWIDDDSWPPSMHGTGSEDYLSQGWGMQKNAFRFAGSIIHESDVPNTQVSYRWHLADPIRFQKKLKVTLEHGHANHLTDDVSTTAYWYQTLPGPRLSLPPVGSRLPRRAVIPQDDITSWTGEPSTDAQRDMIKQREERFAEYKADRDVWINRRAEDSRLRSVKNVELAEEVRVRWLASLS